MYEPVVRRQDQFHDPSIDSICRVESRIKCQFDTMYFCLYLFLNDVQISQVFARRLNKRSLKEISNELYGLCFMNSGYFLEDSFQGRISNDPNEVGSYSCSFAC